MIQYKTPSVCVFESALFRTTSTVIDTPDLVLVVDPTWLPAEVRAIRQYVDAILQDRPLYLLFTHSDYDHIIAYRAFPEARTIGSIAMAQHPNPGAPLEQIRQFDREYYIQRAYPITYPELDDRMEGDDQQMEIGTTRLRCWQAPGHNPDGLFTLVEPLGVWLVGDYLSNIEFPFVYHSFVAYRTTLAKAEQILQVEKPSLLVPGHGDVTTDLKEMRQRVVDAYAYLDRLEYYVRRGKTFPEEELLARYPLAQGMRNFQRGNVALLQKELGIK